MKYKINVLKTDIKKGARCNPSQCAVARAMNRDCKTAGSGFRLFGADGDYAPFGVTSRSRFIVSKKVAAFIYDFDGGFKELKPFSFTVTL